ncbi:hypothetical protein [Streptomyces colonosanans]|nr:hypothetical protein [Streptomyces colonosanans]
MSADQENLDMTHRDITLLLAGAADEVEIGIAPYQAVIRGGRRRRARRWAIAAATTLVLAGSTGATLALAGLPGEGGNRVAPAATQPASPEARHVYVPQRTTLATGIDQGKKWRVHIDVWGVPRDETEARLQLDAMRRSGERPPVRQASDLVGKTSYFVGRSVGDGKSSTIMFNTVKKVEPMSAGDSQFAAVPLDPGTSGPDRLVVGQVAKSTEQVTCTWKDGTTSVVHRVPGYDVNGDQGVIRPAAGSPQNWFVCLGPKGTGSKSVGVPK